MNFYYIDSKKIQGDPNIKLDNNKVSELIGNKPSIVSTGVVEDIEIKNNQENSSQKELEIAELDSLLRENDKVFGEVLNQEPQEILLADDDVLINGGGGGEIIFTGRAINNSILKNNGISFFGSESHLKGKITVTNSSDIDI
jgi:hypothetical protein